MTEDRQEERTAWSGSSCPARRRWSCMEGASPTSWSSSRICPRTRTLSFYRQGDFTDLCAGPHLSNTEQDQGRQAHAHRRRLLARQREEQDAHQRIYGTAFPTKAELQSTIWTALRRPRSSDHRKLGKELDLFDDAGRGPRLPVLPSQGNDAAKHADGLLARDPSRSTGYEEISTPIMLNRTLWETLRPLGSLSAKTCTPPSSTTRTSPSSP